MFPLYELCQQLRLWCCANYQTVELSFHLSLRHCSALLNLMFSPPLSITLSVSSSSPMAAAHNPEFSLLMFATYCFLMYSPGLTTKIMNGFVLLLLFANFPAPLELFGKSNFSQNPLGELPKHFYVNKLPAVSTLSALPEENHI